MPSHIPPSAAPMCSVPQKQPTNSLYLGTVLTLVVLAAVMRHLVTYQVGLPVESFGALVTLVLPLLAVGQHVLLQAAETGMSSTSEQEEEAAECITSKQQQKEEKKPKPQRPTPDKPRSFEPQAHHTGRQSIPSTPQ